MCGTAESRREAEQLRREWAGYYLYRKAFQGWVRSFLVNSRVEPGFVWWIRCKSRRNFQSRITQRRWWASVPKNTRSWSLPTKSDIGDVVRRTRRHGRGGGCWHRASDEEKSGAVKGHAELSLSVFLSVCEHVLRVCVCVCARACVLPCQTTAMTSSM